MAKRESNMSSPTSIEVIIIPDAERVAEAAKRAAPAYRRVLLKLIKQQKDAEKSPA